MTDDFAEARRLVSAREVAELNGLHPNRSGFICCPLHGEKTASLKLYENGSWYCFGCHKGGSSIDLVAALYGLSPLDAVKKLNADFNLNLPIGKKRSPQEHTEAAKEAERRRGIASTYEQFQNWRWSTLRLLAGALHAIDNLQEGINSVEQLDELPESALIAIKERSWIEHLHDTLNLGTVDEMMPIFRQRKEVARVCQSCQSILSDSRPKSAKV